MFNIPFIYSLSHYALGVGAYYFTIIFVGFLCYQFYQYSINRRFFFFDEVKIRMENSLPHTLRKLTEFIIGFVLIYLLNAIYKYCCK
jgi:hypothetical protein